jgi:hypothetical protein
MSDALMKEEDNMDEWLAIYYNTQNMAHFVQQQQAPTAQPRPPKDHHS